MTKTEQGVMLCFPNNDYRIIGYESDYDGGWKFPIVEIKCPICKEFTLQYGEYQEKNHLNEWVEICNICGEANGYDSNN